MRNLLIYVAFLLSGAAGLVYEVIWVRQLGIVIGSTVYSATLVTSLYMLGLGLGGMWIGRFADRRFLVDPLSPLRWYGISELAIGGLGLLVTFLLPQLEVLTAAVAQYRIGPDGWYTLSFFSSFTRYAAAILLLAPMTLLMGGTLTLLIRHLVARDLDAAGLRIGALYGLNTAGAALGCLATDALLVPELGFRATQLLAVSVNLGVGVGALLLARPRHPSAPPEAAERSGHRSASKVPPLATPAEHADVRGRFLRASLAIALSGFASMGMQIVWLRYLIAAFGGERAIFSMLLGVFLLGTWLGSMTGGSLQRWLGRPSLLFCIAQAAFIATALAALAWLDRSALEAPFAETLRAFGGQDGGPLLWRLATYVSILQPSLWVVGIPTFFMGWSYPLVNAHVQRDVSSVGGRAGLLYLANTLGAVLGGMAAGFVLLPALGVQTSTTLMGGTSLLALAAMHWSSAPRQTRIPFALCYAAAGLALVGWIGLPARHMSSRALPDSVHAEGIEIVTLSEGVNETIAIIEGRLRFRTLFTNGHPMSSTNVEAQRYMRAFAHVPLLLRDDAQRVMIMCFGVGNTLHATLLHPQVEEVDVVDYSRHVLEHARYFESTNLGALEDPRVRVFVNDGRLHLRMQPADSYDLITGEPPPIAYAGVATLYSKEFFELAKSRLREGGMMSYWLPIYQVSGEVGLAVIRAFIDAFPNSILLSAYGQELILIGANGDTPALDPERIEARIAANPELARDLKSIYLDDAIELLGLFAASADTMRRASQNVDPVSDDHPVLEYGSVRHRPNRGVPADLFDVGDAEAWCPGCYDDPEESARARAYLSVMDRFYSSPGFARATGNAADIAHLEVPSTPETEAIISESAFLRRLTGSRPGEYAHAAALLNAGDTAGSVAAFEDLLLVAPGNTDVMSALATAYLADGRPRDAATYYELVLQKRPDDRKARRGLRQAKSRLGNQGR